MNRIVLYFVPQYVKIIIAALAFFWSVKASTSFITSSISDKKRNLAIYPVLLFFLFVTWFIR